MRLALKVSIRSSLVNYNEMIVLKSMQLSLARLRTMKNQCKNIRSNNINMHLNLQMEVAKQVYVAFGMRAGD